MLDGAFAGEVFTLPAADLMLEAAWTVQASAAVLNTVKDYSDDERNFERATKPPTLTGGGSPTSPSILVLPQGTAITP